MEKERDQLAAQVASLFKAIPTCEACRGNPMVKACYCTKLESLPAQAARYLAADRGMQAVDASDIVLACEVETALAEWRKACEVQP